MITCYASAKDSECYEEGPERAVEDILEGVDNPTFPFETTIYEGKFDKEPASAYFDISTLLEILQETAYHEHGEYADDWLEKVTKEERQELEMAIKVQINGWATKHDHHPTFYKIYNARPVKIRILNEDGDYKFLTDLKKEA